jgi:ankyrin repeat protein
MKRAREADTITEKSKKARFETLMETHPLRPYLSVKERTNKIELIIDEENFEKALCALEDKNFPIDGIQLEECRKPEQLQSLIEAIKSKSTITSLQVYHPTELLLTSEVTAEFVKALKGNAPSTSPDVENIKVGVLGAGKLAEALRGSATLSPINVEFTYLSDMEAGKLSQALKYDGPLTTHDGLHAIHLAALENNVQILRYLVEEERVDLSPPSESGPKALHLAAKGGSMEAVQYLIGKGADIEAKDQEGITPLHAAALQGHLEIVKYFIENKADIGAQDQEGQTPLHFAASEGHLEVVKCLIENKADIGAKTQQRVISLHVAARNGHLEIVKYLIENKADIEAKTPQGNTSLHFAASEGHLEVVKCLIENKANIMAKTPQGVAPLHTAAYRGHLEVVKCLIENKADIDAKTLQEVTTLHFAAKRGHLEIIKCLIENKADIDAKDQHGETPLHVATSQGHLEIVKCLIENKADIETKDQHGETPLHVATSQGHLEIVKCLIEKGANIDAKDSQGSIPLHVAAYDGHLEIVEYLLENKADIDAKGQWAFTPLHVATSQGHLEIVKCLIENKADIEAKSQHGKTPLFAAAYHGRLEIVKCLIENSAECASAAPVPAPEAIFYHISFGQQLQSLYSEAVLKQSCGLDPLLEFAITIIENYALKVGISEVCIPKIKASTILPYNFRTSLSTFAENLSKEVEDNLELLDYVLLLKMNNQTSIIPYSAIKSFGGHLDESESNAAKDFYTKFPQYQIPGTCILELANIPITDEMSWLSAFMWVDPNILESVELILKLPIPVEARKVLTRALEEYRGCDPKLPQEVVLGMLGVGVVPAESEGVSLPAQDHTQDADYPMGADSNLHQD